jgi:hypothetical protein
MGTAQRSLEHRKLASKTPASESFPNQKVSAPPYLGLNNAEAPAHGSGASAANPNYESNTIFPQPGKAPAPRIDAGSFFLTTHLPDKPDAVVESAKTQAGLISPPSELACVPYRLASTVCAQRAQADTETGQVAVSTCPQQFVNPTVEDAYEEKPQVEKVCIETNEGKDAENAGRCGSKRSSNGCERSHPGIAKADSAKTGAYGGAGATYPAVFLTERVSRRPALSLLLICEQSPRSPR